jgi:hypothetical protein
MSRIIGLIIGSVALLIAFTVMMKISGQPVPQYPEEIITTLPSSGTWARPEGTPRELATTLTVDQLIERWNNWPQREGAEGLHKDYADALALYEEEAEASIPHLSKAVTHLEPNLRKSVMNALASISENGVPHLVKALELWPPKDPNGRAVHIREDAAKFLVKSAGKGYDMTAALRPLHKCLLNPDNSPFTRQHAAKALSLYGTEEARLILEEAKDWFYDQDGLSVEENRVLKNINIGLASFKEEKQE